MREARSEDAFIRAPVGRWCVAGTAVMWCLSPTLCGGAAWGRPTATDARAVLRLFDAFDTLAPRFDVLLDGSAVEGLDPEAVGVLFEWASGRIDDLRRRVRRRIGVVPSGLDGLVLSGITPMLGAPHPDLIVTSPREGFRLLLDDVDERGARASADRADALEQEVSAIVSRVRGTPALLLRLRRWLRERQGIGAVADAARELAVSPRSLQRALTGAGTSFRQETLDARFDAAARLLASTDDKVAAIAARLGVTDAALAQLMRARTGLTPAEFRRQRR